MRYIEGESRDQLALLPASFDDLIPADHLVRVIELFVDGLDLDALSFVRAQPAVTGRPGYDPADLLKLYLYGYLYQTRSSRRLEHECERNVEVMWLLKRLRPDHKTIAEFRRHNAAAFRAVCRGLIRLCKTHDLLGATVAIDGSKFQAVASAKRALNPKRLAQQEAALEREIAAWLSRLDEADATEARAPGAPDRAQIQATIAALKARANDATTARQLMEALGLTQHVVGEPDAKVMKTGQGKRPAYNVQTAVDSDTHLIVHHDVVQDANDTRQLQPMAEAAKTELEQDALTVVADAGYSNGEHLQQCEDNGITPYVPVNRAPNNKGDGQHFQADDFHYDNDTDRFTCPAGQTLKRVQVLNHKRQIYYRAEAVACSACPLKPRCTSGKARTVSRHFEEAAFARATQRLAEKPGMMRLRKSTVEHPFGTLKHVIFGNGRFLVRGLDNVKGEMSLGILAYNLKRLMNLVGAATLHEMLVST